MLYAAFIVTSSLENTFTMICVDKKEQDVFLWSFRFGSRFSLSLFLNEDLAYILGYYKVILALRKGQDTNIFVLVHQFC